jgi:hypothetical protein
MSFLFGDWWEFKDDETGRFYYYNEATQESLWVKPELPTATPTADVEEPEEQRKQQEEEERRKNEEIKQKQQEEAKKQKELEEAAKKLETESPQKKVNFVNFKLSQPWEKNVDDPVPEKVRSPSIIAQSKMVRFLKF